MMLDEYQELAATTAVYPVEYKYAYPSLGLAEEVGEFCEKLLGPRERLDMGHELGDVMWYASAVARDFGLTLSECFVRTDFPASDNPDFAMLFAALRLAGRVKKVLRGDTFDEKKMDQVKLELGRILHCVNVLAQHFDFTMEEICQMNLDKLFDRKERGVLKGDGDNR